MRTAFPSLFLTLGFLATPALAQTPERNFALPGDKACPIDLPEPGPASGWSDAEYWAWEQVCRGRVASMALAGPNGYDGLPCNPAEIQDEVPAHRVLRPEFLRLILTRARWVEALAKPQVRIQCAKLHSRLDLENARVSPELALAQSHLPAGANLVQARFDRNLVFRGSTFRASFFTGASFQDMLFADGLSVGGDLSLASGASFQVVSLVGAQVGGDIYATGSTFEGTFTADRLSVGGNLNLQDGASFPEVRLQGAQVGGNLSAAGSTFEGAFTADGLSVGRNLYFRGGASFQEVGLRGATIAKHVQLGLSRFDGEFNFSGSSAQEFVFFQPVFLAEHGVGSNQPFWGDGARLIFRNARVAAVQSSASSWQREDGGWIAADLSGFNYERLAGFRGDDADTLLDAEAADLNSWLEGTNQGDAGYDPQPYEQLSGVLKAAGMTAKSEAVRYAKFRHRDLSQPGAWYETTLIRPASRFVIGYGVYPFRALYWFAGLVAVGFIIAFFSRAALIRPGYRKFWYSLENALPLVEFSERHKSLEHEHRFVECWFHFQKVMGFVLATVLVGALSLLGG